MAKNLVEILVRAKDEASRELGAANKSLTDTIQNMQKAGQVMAVAGAAIAAGLFAITQAVATTGDEFAKISHRFGLTSDTLSELTFSAELAGGSMQALTVGVRTLAKAASEAHDGVVTYTDAFDALGISVDDASGQLKPLEELLFEIADAMMGMENQTQKVALAQEVLGRGGSELILMLEQGGDAIREQMKEAKALGGSYDEITTKKAEDFIDAQLRIKTSLDGVKKAIGEELMPVMTNWQNQIALVIADIGKWIGANSELVTSLGAVSLILMGGGGVILGAGLLVKMLPLLATGLVALTSPIALIVAGLAGFSLLVYELSGRLKDIKTTIPLEAFDQFAKTINGIHVQFAATNEELGEFIKTMHQLEGTTPTVEQLWSLMQHMVEAGQEGTEEFAKLVEQYMEVAKAAGLVTMNLEEMNAMFAADRDTGDGGVPGLDKDQLAQAEQMQAALAQMAFATEQQRRGFALEGIKMELAQRVAAGEEEFAIIQELAERKLALELEMKREELKQKQELLTAAFEAELEKLPEESEERLALHEEFIAQVAELDAAALDEKVLMETQAHNDLDKLRIQSEENYKKKQAETTKDMVANVKRVGATIQSQLTNSLVGVLRQTGNIRDAFSQIGDTILREVVNTLIQAIVKLIIMKTILKSLSGGLFSGGGIVGPPAPGMMHGGMIRAAGGMLVPAFAGSSGPRSGTDNVPILATAGEAILPVWLTNALRAVLGGGGSQGRFQSGGTVSANSGVPAIIIQGNVYTNDEQQVDDLMERMSDAVRFRNVPLHASIAREIG